MLTYLSRRACMLVLCISVGSSAQAQIVQESWDWVTTCKKIVKSFRGTPGTVCHFGDSITYSNGYSQWARYGKGKTAGDNAILQWMHVQSRGPDTPTAKPDDFPAILNAWKNDGFWLAYVDRPGGGSMTAQSGIRTDQYINGSYNLPPLEAMLDAYNPQIAIIMLGTNDASANRPAAQVAQNMEQIIAHVLWQDGRKSTQFRGTIPVLSTIPPKKDDLADVNAYNQAFVLLAKKYKIPLIDFYGHCMSRHPNDWLGTLISGDGVHPSANDAAGDPYVNNGANLSRSGLLLRCWLSVQKVKEIAARALSMNIPK